MAKFKPGDRVSVKTDYYNVTSPDYNSGEGTVVQVGCGSGCACGDYYEVLHDLDAVSDNSWEDTNPSQWTPYGESELTKID